MNNKIILPALCTFLIFGSALDSLNPNRASSASFVDGETLILYDAASGDGVS